MCSDSLSVHFYIHFNQAFRSLEFNHLICILLVDECFTGFIRNLQRSIHSLDQLWTPWIITSITFLSFIIILGKHRLQFTNIEIEMPYFNLSFIWIYIIGIRISRAICLLIVFIKWSWAHCINDFNLYLRRVFSVL